MRIRFNQGLAHAGSLSPDKSPEETSLDLRIAYRKRRRSPKTRVPSGQRPVAKILSLLLSIAAGFAGACCLTHHSTSITTSIGNTITSELPGLPPNSDPPTPAPSYSPEKCYDVQGQITSCNPCRYDPTRCDLDQRSVIHGAGGL